MPTIAIQAAFLAAKDSVTPLVAVLVGAVVNLCGDLLLVNVFNLGIEGAAWATMLSQFASFVYLLKSEFKLSFLNGKWGCVLLQPQTLSKKPGRPDLPCAPA